MWGLLAAHGTCFWVDFGPLWGLRGPKPDLSTAYPQEKSKNGPQLGYPCRRYVRGTPPMARYWKAIPAILAAVLTILAAYDVIGVGQAKELEVSILAVLGALGVYAAPRNVYS